MANVPVPDHTGTQNYNGYGTDQVYYSMPQQFAPPAPIPNLAVVATGGGLAPMVLPDHMAVVGPQDATYRTLFAALDPTGAPARGWLPGTYMAPPGALGAMPRGV